MTIQRSAPVGSTPARSRPVLAVLPPPAARHAVNEEALRETFWRIACVETEISRRRLAELLIEILAVRTPSSQLRHAIRLALVGYVDEDGRDEPLRHLPGWEIPQ